MSVKIQQNSPTEIIIDDIVAQKIDGKWTISKPLSPSQSEAFRLHLKAICPAIDTRRNSMYWQKQSEYFER